jgi:hypothetical protein
MNVNEDGTQTTASPGAHHAGGNGLPERAGRMLHLSVCTHAALLFQVAYLAALGHPAWPLIDDAVIPPSHPAR